MASLRHLVIVLGDQLDLVSSAFDGFDPAQDCVWMAEVSEESTHIPSGKARIALFLSAMRHHAQALAGAGRPLRYVRLDDPDNQGSLAAQLAHDLADLRPQQLVMTAPGDWRVLQALQATARAAGLPLEIRDDRHFFVSVREFRAYARDRSALRMEYFYRAQRRQHRILMDGDAPAGGRWNFDTENRQSFGARGPGFVPPPSRFEPDDITRSVIALVQQRFAGHPGQLDQFAWPVTRAQAVQALQVFIAERLPDFGRYQDAIWPGEPWLYHAHLAAALNLKLL